jgi:hypothetical protein
MSKRIKSMVQPRAVPIPKALVRAQVAGELIHACGGSPGEVEIGQKGVVRRLLEKVIVYGIDSQGDARDKIEFSFTGDASGDVMLDLDGGNRSALEALDGGLGRAVAYAANRIRHRGLRPDVRYVFTDEIYADPERLASARLELGVSSIDEPSWGAGYHPREILRIRPSKDSGILGAFYTAFGNEKDIL